MSNPLLLKATTKIAQNTRIHQPIKQLQSLLLFLIVGFLTLPADALINVPVSQVSSLKDFILKDTHAYFDISYEGQGNLIQADNNATYMFSKISQRSANRYQFVAIPHTTQNPETVYDTITLDGYQVFGLCQFNGSLDYVVALDTSTNELRVIRFSFSGTSAVINDFKTVDKDDKNKKLTGTVFVDCAYQTTYKGQNNYVIAIAGTYFHSNQISSYYLAKFSTKYNFTEYMVLSEDQEVMEAARGVKVDLDNNMIYLAVEINKQKYHGRTVYQPGDSPGEDNSNVAIHGYSWYHGVRTWTTVLGNVNFTDKFSRMEPWGNYLYVFLNSFSTEYSTTSNYDIYYYRIRTLNGVIELQKIFGSPLDDKILDLRITFNGLYVLAYINDQLLPHKYNDRIWQTKNGAASIALIWMDFEDDILDIEGYDLSTLQFTNYPQKLFVPRIGNASSTMQSFVFIAPRSNAAIDQNGGFYVTYFQDSFNIFAQTIGCGDTCQKCSSQVPSKCFQCKWSYGTEYQLYKHVCYPRYQCPDFTYNVYDSDGKLNLFCKDCHYSCKNCTGPKKDQCTTCCTDNVCGPILNRVPNLGTCSCPEGLADSNGYCVQRCVLNLAGKRGDFCYPQCPANSLPFMRFDNPASSQERSQYDGASQTDCMQSSYHLKFASGNSGEGKGLAIQGPPDLSAVPEEFTIALWVRPTMLLAKSYFVNAFNRVYVKASSSNQAVQFIYTTGPLPTDILEPVYNTLYNKVLMDNWNYISISFRSLLIGNVERYEQVLAMAQTNMGIVYEAGHDNTQPKTTYTKFSNTIYLGAYNDIEPQSFTGFLKEFKLFTKFHGFKQMQDQQLRMYRYYSYDDPNLVAYWKLTENYLPTDIEYTIKDYSINQNSITYSLISSPLSPSFLFDQSFSLSLCYFHDVSICKSVDYSNSHPHVVTQRRAVQAPTFNIGDLTHVRETGDQVWFVNNNTQCIQENIVASMVFKAAPVYQWYLNNDNANPSINLTMGKHYQVCYYISSLKQAFSLYQIYLISSPMTIDPSTSDAFMSDGVSRIWGSAGGDQGFSDQVKFSLNCDRTETTDYEMYRNTIPSFGQHFMKNWTYPGDYYFCWMPTYVQETDMPYYHPIHDLKFRIVSVPTVNTAATVVANMNEDMVRFDLSGAFVEGDMIKVSWKGLVLADCNPDNFIGNMFVRNFSYWPSFWFGYQTGIYGIKNNSMDELHLCYQSVAHDAPQAWSRIKKTTGTAYFVRVEKYFDTTVAKCPELVSFYPMYGSTELSEFDTQIKFSFNNQAVFPSRVSDSPIVFGQIIIYRGALRPDGTIVRTTEILWKNDRLSDIGQVDPLTQGDLLCSGFGQCSIVLSTTSSRMKAGEIFFLSFYKNSFSYKITKESLTRYYLFNAKNLEVGQDSAYDHLFFCRSFNVSYSNQMINGRQFSMQGIDFRYKLIRQVLEEGYSKEALFQTKAINLHMVVKNTLDTYCVTNPPIATVNMEDVFQTNFTVYNLELRQCNEGVLYADIELVRGKQDQYGVFTHVRSEWHKNIKIGDIGCDTSCTFCNGTTSQDCIVCKSSIPFLADGKCYANCPSYAPYYMNRVVVYQKKKWDAPFCISQCPLGYYPDQITNECQECNLDCQTCNRSEIKSCMTCKPVKYLFDGLCVSDCPQPHHQNNFSSYQCVEISRTQYLNVRIQSLGYKLKIPKDQQTFLRAVINNDGGGSIISIKWDQLEPAAENLDMLVFTVSSDGEVDDKSQTVRLKMTALNYIAASQVVKVQCTVTNSMGEVAYDIYEFFQNAPPDQLALGATTNLNMFGSLGLGNGTTGDTIFMLNATNWQDSDYINFKAFMILDNAYVTLSDQVPQLLPESTPTMLYFRLPLFSTTDATKSIQVCVLATDYAYATAQKCISLSNVTNNLNYAKNLTIIQKQLLPLTFEGNLTNAVYAAQMMHQVMSSPKRPPSSPGLCSMDYHCNGNGKCQSLLGNQRCVCNIGYSGSFCQFKGSQLNDFVKITTKIITALYNKMNALPFITPNEVELVGVIFRGILKDPDTVDDSLFETIVAMFEMIGDADQYAHYPITTDIREAYMDSLSAVMNKLFHSYKVKRAVSNVVKLSKQESINSQYIFIANQQRRLRLLFGRNLESSTVPTQSPLISGIAARQAKLAAAKDSTQGGPLYQRWGRRLDKQLNSFIEKFLRKLNPIYPSYSYSSSVMQLLVQSGKASQFKDVSLYIKEKDVIWYIPESVFDNAQGRASDKHDVYLKVQKYLANPFFFEKDPGAFVETNVTELTFYDAGGNHINITLTNDKEYIIISEPFIKTQGYESELLRCMSWNESGNTFANDGTCSYNKIYSLVPCLTCEEGYQPNLTVSLCRCKHLSRFATVYTQTMASKGRGPQIGLFVNFESMDYWSKSFGFYLTIGAALFYFIFLGVFLLIDKYTVPKILARMIARVKRLELKGFKQKEAKKLTVYRDEKGKIIFKRNPDAVKKDENGDAVNEKGEVEDDSEKKLAQEQDDAVIQLKKEGVDIPDDDAKAKKNDDDNVDEAYLTPAKGKKGGKVAKGPADMEASSSKKLVRGNQTTIRKAFKDEEDDEAEVMKAKAKAKGGKAKKGPSSEDTDEKSEEQKNSEENLKKKKKKAKIEVAGDGGYINEYGEWIEGSAGDADGENNEGEEENEEEEEEEEDVEALEAKKRAENDVFEQQMLKKWEEEQEVMEFVKQHGTSSSEEDKAEKNRNKEQKLYLKLERKAKERYWYNLKSLVIHGNGLLSLLLINSMLMPRHVRFTLFFTNLLLNFFWCAVIIKNSQQQLLLPDLSSTTPSDIASADLWIAIMSPFGTTIVMYVFAGLFKISDARLNNSYTMVYLEQMLVELRKEMKMRFIIAYCICLAVYSAIFWYIIKFTAAYGWHVSWVWWYSGCFAVLIQYFGFDLGVAFLQWIIHWCSHNLSIFWMQIRMVKMCRQEA